jgi:hypothetical protein
MRKHRKLFRITDAIGDLRRQEGEVEAELAAHRLISDDAQRDAALGVDRLEASVTAADVVRFERLLLHLRARRERLEAKRSRLLETLGDP